MPGGTGSDCASQKVLIKNVKTLYNQPRNHESKISSFFFKNRSLLLESIFFAIFSRWPDDKKSPEMNATERDLNPQKKISFQLPIVAEKS